MKPRCAAPAMVRRRNWVLKLAVIVALLSLGAAPSVEAASGQLALYLPIPSSGHPNADLATEFDLWRQSMHRLGLAWQESSDLRRLLARRPALLILPHTRGLSAGDLEAIVRQQRRGMALMVTGPLGLAHDGKPTSPAARRLLGAELQALAQAVPAATPTIQRDTGVHISSLPLTPLTTAIEAGTRVTFSERAWLLAPPVGAQPAAEFTEWMYRSPSSGGEPLHAVWLGRQKHGARWAYFGFEFNKAALMQGHRSATERLNDAALRWLVRRDASVDRAPATVADWPPGQRSAQLVEMDTELDVRKDLKGFEAARAFASIIQAAQAHASFYGVTEDFALDPALLRELHAAGHELGLHGERHAAFGENSATEQARRIAAMLQAWRALQPDARAVGFRAPYESYNLDTLKLLEAAGLAYHVSDAAGAPARLPYFVDVGPGRRLLNLPRTQPDDYHFVSQHIPADKALVQVTIDADAAERFGALGLLSVHPQHFEPDAPVRQALPSLLERWRDPAHGVWLATGAEIAAWWQMRDRVRVMPEAGGLRLDVQGAAPVGAVSVVVAGDTGPRGVHVEPGSPARVEAPRPWGPPDAPRWQTELRVFDLPPGTTRLRWGPR